MEEVKNNDENVIKLKRFLAIETPEAVKQPKD